MSTHLTCNVDDDVNPECDLKVSSNSIQLNAKNMLRLMENSFNKGLVTDICKSTENYPTKQPLSPPVAPSKDSHKANTDAGEVANSDGTIVEEGTFMNSSTQVTRYNPTELNNNNSIQSTVSARRPGAHAVDGINGHLLDQPLFLSEELIDFPVGIDDDTPTLFTATLVLEENLPERQLMETPHSALSAVPMEDPQKSRQRWCYILMAVATLFAGIGGAIVAVISSQQKNKSVASNPTTTPSLSPSLTPSQEPTFTPSFQPSSMMEGLYTIVALDLDTGLPAKNTSQHKALNWLLDQNAVVQYSTEELRQRFALATLIFSTESILVTDVLSSDSHCTWPGIICGTQVGINDKQVIGIDINFTMAAASYDKETCVTLPPELALLFNSITFLRFPEYAVRGMIPTELGLLTALRELTIGQQYGSVENGALPSEIGQLSKLTHLSLRNYGINGTLPTQIGRLTDLLHLDLATNYLASSMPSEIGKLIQLRYFDTEWNQFNNNFPYQVGSLTNLEYFNIANNNFGGDEYRYLPLELTKLTKLEYLNAGYNKIQGFKNSFCCSEENSHPNLAALLTSQLGQLTLLTNLQLNSNNIKSSIPAEIGNLVNLNHLDLFQNRLSGTLPSTLGFLTNLIRMDLRINLLQGTIPSELDLLTNLESVDFSENEFSGKPPNNLSKLVKLQYLNMQLNAINGVINCSLYGELLSLVNVDCSEVFCNGNCTCVNFVQSTTGPMNLFCPLLEENSTGF